MSCRKPPKSRARTSKTHFSPPFWQTASGDGDKAARKVLAKDHNQELIEPNVPAWLTRCSEPHRRIILFFAGAGLILISFICFGPAEQT